MFMFAVNNSNQSGVMKKYFILLLFISTGSLSQTTEKEYYFVFLNSNPDRAELPEDSVKQLQQEHMNNINRLAREGKLITAGPVKGGGGIFVLYASSLDEANEFLRTDPAIKASRFKLEVYPMTILNGNLCKVPEEDFEMASYTLVRYMESILVNDKNKILFQIRFPEKREGVAILQYDLEKGNDKELNSYFSTDGLIYTKTLWIAKGSFCEE